MEVEPMIQCDCDERIGVKINSWNLFKELKKFFEKQVEKGVFVEIPVEEPYYVGYGMDGKAMKWYPDFPAQGFVGKLSFEKNQKSEEAEERELLDNE